MLRRFGLGQGLSGHSKGRVSRLAGEIGGKSLLSGLTYQGRLACLWTNGTWFRRRRIQHARLHVLHSTNLIERSRTNHAATSMSPASSPGRRPPSSVPPGLSCSDRTMNRPSSGRRNDASVGQSSRSIHSSACQSWRQISPAMQEKCGDRHTNLRGHHRNSRLMHGAQKCIAVLRRRRASNRT